MKARAFIFLGVFLFVFSCTKEVGTLKPVEIDCSKVTYGNDINPIISSKCTKCHVGSFVYGDFTSYPDLKARVDNGRFKLWVIDTKLMPPSGPLSTVELKKIQCWLDAGAPNN